MQRAGPGDDEAPSGQLDALSPRQRAKLLPAPSEHGEKMLEECGPLGDQGAALTTAGDPGAHLDQ